MAYSNEIEVVPAATAPSTIEVRVWNNLEKAPKIPDFAPGIFDPNALPNEIVVETVSVPFQTTAAFTTNSGPTAGKPLVSIGLSVHFGANPGPLFRSGYFEVLPIPRPTDPNGYISIIEAPWVTTTQAALNTALVAPPPTGLGPPPFPVPDDPSTTVTALAVVIGSGKLTVTASGVTTRIAGAPITFTYTVDFVIAPTRGMLPDTSRILDVSFTGPGTLSFAPSPAGPPFGSVPFLAFLNLISGFIVGTVDATIMATLNEKLNASALSAALQILGGSGGSLSTLPAGVVLSASRVTVGTLGGVTGIHVVPALGCFGNLTNRIMPAGSNGAGPCALAALSAMLFNGPSLNLRTFRKARSLTLRNSSAVPWVQRYYRHSPEVAVILHADRRLAKRAYVLACELEQQLASDSPLSKQNVTAMIELIGSITPRASEGLRNTLSELTASADHWVSTASVNEVIGSFVRADFPSVPPAPRGQLGIV